MRPRPNVIKLFTVAFTNVHNKLWCLFWPASPVQSNVSEYNQSLPERITFQGLYTKTNLLDFRLGWSGLQETNTLTYYKNSQITAVKRFITLGSGPNIIKLFTAVIYECSQ